VLGNALTETRLLECLVLTNKDEVVAAGEACWDESCSILVVEVAAFIVDIPAPVLMNGCPLSPFCGGCEMSYGLINELGCICGLSEPGLMINREQIQSAISEIG
jgi:hypothetical protein